VESGRQDALRHPPPLAPVHTDRHANSIASSLSSNAPCPAEIRARSFTLAPRLITGLRPIPPQLCGHIRNHRQHTIVVTRAAVTNIPSRAPHTPAGEKSTDSRGVLDIVSRSPPSLSTEAIALPGVIRTDLGTCDAARSLFPRVGGGANRRHIARPNTTVRVNDQIAHGRAGCRICNQQAIGLAYRRGNDEALCRISTCQIARRSRAQK